MKNLKKAVRRAICVLLTAAMLCADTGVTVYAAEGAEQKVSEGTVEETQAEDLSVEASSVEDGQTEGTSTGEVQTEDGQAEESSTVNDASMGIEQAEENVTEEGETGKPSSEETPVKEGTADENAGGENTETGVTEENPVAEDEVTEEEPEVEAVENTGEVSADAFVLENDIEDAAEDLTMAARDAEDDVIARGEYKEDGNDITWVIDADGKLTVTGTGNFAEDGDWRRAPWYDQRMSIKSAEINVTGMTDASGMFSDCQNLEEVDLGQFDTSNVTDMHRMFADCHSLQSLDLSQFDTSKVTDMYGMFYDCYVLEELDLSHFKTSNVTDMRNMFLQCYKLQSLNLEGFDTSKVTDMSFIFMNCNNLAELDLSHFKTANVTCMNWMFADCHSLKSLDVGSFDTSNVRDMSNMFRGCRSLQSLDVGSFDTSNVTNMSDMFCGCSGLTSLGVSNFVTGNVTNMSNMFEGCSNFTGLNVSNFNTNCVENMTAMFAGCSSLTSLDLSNFSCNLIEMASMFWGCSNLKSLDLSRFDVSKVENTSDIFTGCTNLTTIHTPLNLVQTVVLPETPTDIWYQSDGTEITELPQNLNYSIVIRKDEVPVLTSAITVRKTKTTYACEDTLNIDDLIVTYYDADGKSTKITDGYSTNVGEIDMTTAGRKTLKVIYNGMTATVELTVKETISDFFGEDGKWVIDTEGKLTVEGTSDFWWSNSPAPWCQYKNDITSAEINVTNVTDASYMFYDCKFLTSVNLKGFDTSKVTNMSFMFYGCSHLTSLDWGEFDTSNVTDMSDMFYGCNHLTSLDLSGFDTSKVTNMSSMFGECSDLAGLDLSNFDTSSVTNMSHMFGNCNNLTNLDLSNFDTSSVTDMSFMFYQCDNLPRLDLRSFDVRNVTEIICMFYECYELQTIYTPYNLTVAVELPAYGWYRADGTQIRELPQNLDHSILIRRNEIPVFSAIKAKKEKIDYVCGDIINIDDLTVTYYDADGTAHEIGSGDYATNADEIDMSTAGKKTLIITYLNGENVFTDEIELTVTAKESGDPQEIPVESISISRNKLSLKVGETARLVAKITPDNVTDPTVTWKSSNEKIAEVKNGVVRAVAVGKCTITASAGDQEAVCYVSIANNEITNKIILNANNTSITLSDTYDYVYDGKSKTPEVTVVCTVSENSVSGNSISENYANGSAVTLEKDTDYTVTYENNVNAFEDRKDLETAQNAPKVVITGRNKYSGTVKKAFSIQMAAAPAGEEETVSILDYSVAQEGRTVDLSGCFAGYGGKTGYSVGTPVEDNSIVGSVLSGKPSVDEKGLLTYGTNAGEAKDFAVIPIVVFFTNYKDAVLNVKILFEDRSVAVPVATPESGRQLVAGSKVTLTCETAGAEIYYTTANSEKALTEPTETSIRYTEPITINKDMYIKAVAIKGDIRSKSVTLHYTVIDAADKVLKPYAVPGQGAVEKGTKVELKSDTPDAVIYYVTGRNEDMLGAVPVDESHKYTEPIEITKDMVIKAIAKKDGMKDSDFSTFTYKIKVTIDPPAAVPASGTVDRGDYISLNADSDVNIYYTIDQSNPMTSGSAKPYENKIRVDGAWGNDLVIKAVAEKNGIYSEIVTFTYTISENTVKGLQVMLAGSEEFTYTGSAITPSVIVTNNGEELTEGEDYTVRYSNNVKAADKAASKAPKITVTGKGNLAKSRSITFSILPKDIGDEEEVVGGNIVVVEGKTASPVLFYGGVKLTAKDFVNPDAKKKYSQDETITITGKGNFEGTRDIDVRVVAKEDLKKFTVTIDNQALKEEPLIYDGEAKTLDGYFEVFDTADKSTPLEEYSDYAVIYPKNNINAGKVKFTVVGLGEYYGTVTKSYTIKPRVVKTDTDGNMDVNVNDGDNYSFRNGIVTIPDLTVTCDGDVLVPGKDYKVTYSNNKKICTGNKAKCTISFTGNYKGSKALVRKFNITPAVLDDVDQINGSVSVAVGDMVYTGRPGAYKSVPYVTVNGVLLKSTDYRTSYYKDQDRKQVIDGKTASSSVNLAGGDKQTVYVKIEGKGNYQGTLTAEYNVYKLAEDFIDLAKAKVSFVGGNKAEYTGKGVRPEIEVMYKSGREWKKVDANDIGTYVTLTYINNVNKGKATVMINGNGGKYAGSKTAVFSIVPKSIK